MKAYIPAPVADILGTVPRGTWYFYIASDRWVEAERDHRERPGDRLADLCKVRVTPSTPMEEVQRQVDEALDNVKWWAAEHG